MNSHNDLVRRIAARAKELADLPLADLRELPHVGAQTMAEQRAATRGWGRGRLVEWVLCEEFERDQDFDLGPSDPSP